MPTVRQFCVTLLVWLVLAPADALALHLRGSIVHVGFPGSGSAQMERGAHYYRVGSWVPILVELTNDDSDRFEGRLEVRQPDRDGDEVIARRDVVLQGQGTRQFFLYIPGGKFDRPEQFSIWVFDTAGQFAELRDDAGKPVTELRPPPTLLPAPTEARLVLDISARPLNQLEGLARDDRLARGLVVMRGSPREIPDDAAGLRMVDTIVWDGADPTEIDLLQRNALMHWVRMGGKLVLGVSRNWDRVNEGKFGEMLPARPRGTSSLVEMPKWLESALGVGAFDSVSGRLNPPLTYCPILRADLAGDATAIAFFEGEESSAEAGDEAAGHLLATRRPVGRGEVVLVAAELQDLLRHGRQNPVMLRELLAIRTGVPRERDLNQAGGMLSSEKDLFVAVQDLTAFAITGGLYVLIAFVFVVVYIAVATAGGWFWLKSKGWVQHSWNLFAATALVGGLVSVVTVQWIRGFSYEVRELSVVDTRAGQSEAVMTGFFGLKSPAHSRLDLRMPADWTAPDEVGTGGACLLRPMPSISEIEGRYSAVDQYEAVAPLGELRAVPLRATLKQFEADWQGRLAGRLNADIKRARAGALELDPSSWIQNDLGTDLHDCYLLMTNRPVRSDRPYRDQFIEVYNIGVLPRGKRIAVQDLNDQADAFIRTRTEGNADAPRIREIRDDFLSPVLQRTIGGQWLPGFFSAIQFIQTNPDDRLTVRRPQDQFVQALMLLSVYNEVNVSGLLNEGNELRRTHGVELDRSDWIQPAESLFVGFSKAPGPARLCYRKSERANGSWTPLTPSQANVMYRVAIPVR